MREITITIRPDHYEAVLETARREGLTIEEAASFEFARGQKIVQSLRSMAADSKGSITAQYGKVARHAQMR